MSYLFLSEVVNRYRCLYLYFFPLFIYYGWKVRVNLYLWIWQVCLHHFQISTNESVSVVCWLRAVACCSAECVDRQHVIEITGNKKINSSNRKFILASIVHYISCVSISLNSSVIYYYAIRLLMNKSFLRTHSLIFLINCYLKLSSC